MTSFGWKRVFAFVPSVKLTLTILMVEVGFGGGVNVLVGGNANPCTFARIGKRAWPNSSKPCKGTLFVVLTYTQPPSEARCNTAGISSESRAVRRPGPNAAGAMPTNCPSRSMAYTSTFATVFVVLRRAIPVYHGERPAICPKKNRVEPVDCGGTTANEPLAKSR